MIATSVRLRSFALVAFILMVATSPCIAQSKADPICRYVEAQADNRPIVDWLANFYTAHAHPVLGPEQRLANGVSWRLLIEETTKLAMPRITWMADRQAMQRANRLFEALHGCLLLQFDGLAADWYDAAKKEADESGQVRPTVPRGSFVWQPIELVSLTYATPALMSYSELRVERRDGGNVPVSIGRILDLGRGKLVSVERCDRDDLPNTLDAPFTLGEFLDTCDPQVHASFIELWKGKLSAMMKVTAHQKDAGVLRCKEDLDTSPVAARTLALSLRPDGLAIYARPAGLSAADCVFDKSPANPVIVPYRELEPFMKPGPWRDELLQQGG